MDTHEFSDWFQRQLKSRGWTQRGFAKRARLSPSTVSEWYRGTRNPDPTSVDIIADVFGMDLDFVLTKAGHRPDVEGIDDDPVKAEIIAKIERIALTGERPKTLEGLLDLWMDLDRRAAEGVDEGRDERNEP